MHIRKEIVGKFFGKGHLLTPEALEFLANSKDYTKMLENLAISDKMVIEKDDFSAFNATTNTVKIIKNLPAKPAELSPELFNKFYVSKFEKMKTIFLERTDKSFISLDKIDNYRQEVFVIGMVKEFSNDSGKLTIELEDRTKSIKAVFENYTPKTPLEEEDVVCIRGIGSKEVIFGKEIIYPDVPIREPVKGAGKICIISDLHLDEAPVDIFVKFLKWLSKQDIEYLLVSGDIGDMKKFSSLTRENIPDKTIFIIPGNVDDGSYPSLQPAGGDAVGLSNPSIIEINGIKILLIHKFDPSYLKKRYLGKSSLILDEDYLVLDTLPDIVAYGHTHEPGVSNYKSITLANPGSLLSEFRPVVINLENREYQQMSFD